MSNRAFIETELKDNPEFFKAFPHLQSVFDDKDKETTTEGYLGNREYQGSKIVNFSNLQESPAYFEGLLHQQDNFKQTEANLEEIYR